MVGNSDYSSIISSGLISINSRNRNSLISTVFCGFSDIIGVIGRIMDASCAVDINRIKEILISTRSGL